MKPSKIRRPLLKTHPLEQLDKRLVQMRNVRVKIRERQSKLMKK